MIKCSAFRYCKMSPEIIRLAVILYVRFPLSLRNVEDWCCMASRIGYPISEPAIIDLQIAIADGRPAEDFPNTVEELVTVQLQDIPKLIERFIDGQIDLF